MPLSDGLLVERFLSTRRTAGPQPGRKAGHGRTRSRPQGAAAPGGSEHRHGAEATRLQLAGQLMRQLGRNEAGLLHGETAAAIEDDMALGIMRLDPTGIDIDRQLADFAAGRRGSHHEEARDTRVRPRL
jgi:hypothetical protein